jgi:hypothetical protein
MIYESIMGCNMLGPDPLVLPWNSQRSFQDSRLPGMNEPIRMLRLHQGGRDPSEREDRDRGKIEK